ncbi:glycosyltransferase family 2 [Phlyctema vagabunda]|uniref:chitin synthase n=1 Tax=Phlyctema vagabunda TaxID=108571 RepID=A0ABR4PD13_9HELO
MDTSNRFLSGSSDAAQNPFEDPTPSNGSSVSFQSESSQSTGPVITRPPAVFTPPDVPPPNTHEPRHLHHVRGGIPRRLIADDEGETQPGVVPRSPSSLQHLESDQTKRHDPVVHPQTQVNSFRKQHHRPAPQPPFDDDTIIMAPRVGELPASRNQSQPVQLRRASDNVQYEDDDSLASSSPSSRIPLPEPLDRSPEAIKSGRRWITVTKWIFISALICANAFSIFATWWWPKYYYIFLPFITITVAINCIMVVSVIVHTLLHKAIPEKEYLPAEPESMVLLLPCYNETREECTKSLDSLVDQINLEDHKKSIIIVCDGQARGPGMEKTTGEYLLEDILSDGQETREFIPAAYTSWDHTEMDVTVQRGNYGGIPYFCIVKQTNKGKRDGLILIRSYLYNFNIRASKPATILSPYFFGAMTSFLTSATFDKVDILIGMDGDTFFEPQCIDELIKQSHFRQTVGVCGYVTVDFKDSSWSAWSLYQNTEYTISQCLRRLHQSIATHKVSCLPGCCQLLKICEETCGDRIMLELFGYHPTAKDHLLKQIRATASEDRNHVCLMLSAFPKSRTRQALRARAYTDVPHSWSVFLSQRRRWTLGATANDLFLILAPGTMWFERILALANVMTWFLNFFIIACLASFIKACTFVSYELILAFASVMMVPFLYYVMVFVWQPRGIKERVQYLAGLCFYFFLGPFINVIVLCYALWSIDNFAWGKTRQVVAVVENEKITEKALPRDDQV